MHNRNYQLLVLARRRTVSMDLRSSIWSSARCRANTASCQAAAQPIQVEFGHFQEVALRRKRATGDQRVEAGQTG